MAYLRHAIYGRNTSSHYMAGYLIKPLWGFESLMLVSITKLESYSINAKKQKPCIFLHFLIF